MSRLTAQNNSALKANSTHSGRRKCARCKDGRCKLCVYRSQLADPDYAPAASGAAGQKSLLRVHQDVMSARAQEAMLAALMQVCGEHKVSPRGVGDLLIALGEELNGGKRPHERRRESGATFVLPPTLSAFTPLGEQSSVVVKFEVLNAAAAEIGGDVENPALLLRLRELVADASTTVAAAAEETLRSSEQNLVAVSNEGPAFFGDVYASVWHTIEAGETSGVSSYRASAEELRLRVVARRSELRVASRGADRLAATQPSEDVVSVFAQAARTWPRFEREVKRLAQKFQNVECKLDFKAISRVVEKCALRPDAPGSAEKCVDLCRAMLVAPNMAVLAQLLVAFAAPDSAFDVVRFKDRVGNPTSSGWRDSNLNVRLREGQKHVCEVQLVHSTMLRAREDFHGHQVYDRVRNADELIAFQYRAYCRRLNCNTALQWALWVPRIERAENFTLHPKTGALLKVRLFAESDLASGKLADLVQPLNTQELAEIDLHNCDRLFGDLKPLTAMRALTSLVCLGCTRLTGTLEPLTAHLRLKRLELEGCEGLSGSLESLASCASLEIINVDGCRRLKGDLRFAASLSALRELNISETECGGSLQPLATCAKLTRLSLRYCAVDGQIEPLANCAALEQIDCSHASNLTGSIEPLAQLPRLETLVLFSCLKVEGDVGCLSACKRLASLNVAQCKRITGAESFARDRGSSCEVRFD